METMLNTSVNVHASEAASKFWITDYPDFATLSLEAESEGSHHTVCWFTNPDQLADLYAVLEANHHVADVMRRRARAAIEAAGSGGATLAPGGTSEARELDATGGGVAPQELRHVGTLIAMQRWPYCPACRHHANYHNAGRPDDSDCFHTGADPDDPCGCPVMVDLDARAFISGVAGGGL